MGITLPPALRSALKEPSSMKILATVNKFGEPHLAFNQSLRLREDSNLEYDEIVENSINSRNMLHAIWSNKIIVVSVFTNDRRGFKVAAKPIRAIATGQDFQTRYEALRKNGRGFELGTVWILEPLSFIETTAERPAPDDKKTGTIAFRPKKRFYGLGQPFYSS
ncbi:MAG: hypothetical protein LBR53_01645 [Deltaproteobacteria bacterium]|jgi:hypothetical protein|nr:hypothetical protein [Deltaproteobacteria bacterium]